MKKLFCVLWAVVGLSSVLPESAALAQTTAAPARNVLLAAAKKPAVQKARVIHPVRHRHPRLRRRVRRLRRHIRALRRRLRHLKH